MSEIASKSQLRIAYLRWAIVTVPFILLLGFASARLVPVGTDNLWYQQLAKPAGTPPPWVFGAAWGLLYVLMGLALAMVINARGARLRVPALLVFAAQMVLNLAWTPLFFGAHRVEAALVVIGVLIVLVAVTIFLFYKVRVISGVMLLPYLLWLCFAGYLLWQVNLLNPDARTLVPTAVTDQIEIR